MIARLLSMMACVIAVSAVHAGEPQRVDSAAPARTQPPALPMLIGAAATESPTGNPFKPSVPAPKTAPISVEPPPPQLPPTELARLEERDRFRNEGRFVGRIDGHTIYQHDGRYLIETEPQTRSAKQAGADSASCVVRIVGKRVGAAERAASSADNAKLSNTRESPQ